MAFEWWINEQYSYGFLVPFLVLYLFSLKWGDRPTPATTSISTSTYLALALTSSVLIPLRVVLYANPEWRAALWLYGIITLLATLMLFAAIGGRKWVAHFAGPFLLMLFAIPWPTMIEQPIVHWLMRWVAIITVDASNFLGVFALREGNLIRLTNHLVGVEEACSGVRSFQSTLMAAYFLGELFQWKLAYRIALITSGSLVSLLLNLVRTFSLTILSAKKGPQVMETFHDPVGHIISILAFAILFFIAWMLHRQFRQWVPESVPQVGPRQPPSHPISIRAFSLLLCILGAQYLITYKWYQPTQDSNSRILLHMNWAQLDNRFKTVDISPTVRGMLRYSEGEHVQMRSGTNFFAGFIFRWEPGRISSHAGVHRPEVCLPAAGFKIKSREEPFIYKEDDLAKLTLQFESLVFESNEIPYYVFFSVWDTEPGVITPLSQNWSERLTSAWNHLPIRERQSLEIVITGPSSIHGARLQMTRLMQKAAQFKQVYY